MPNDDNALRIKVAELCGWKEIDQCAGARKWMWRNDPEVTTWMLPDYCNDLNAMHEAILAASDPVKQLIVEEIVGKKWHESWTFEDAMKLLSASAYDLAEAFVKTMEGRDAKG